MIPDWIICFFKISPSSVVCFNINIARLYILLQNKHDHLSDPLLVYKYWIEMKILGEVSLYFYLQLCIFGLISNILGIRPLQSRDAKSRLNLLDPHGILIVTESWTKNNSRTSIFIWNNSIRNNYAKLQFQTK